MSLMSVTLRTSQPAIGPYSGCAYSGPPISKASVTASRIVASVSGGGGGGTYGGGGGGGTYGTPGGHSPEVIGRRNTDRAGVGCAAAVEYRSRSASQSLRSSGVRSRGS